MCNERTYSEDEEREFRELQKEYEEMLREQDELYGYTEFKKPYDEKTCLKIRKRLGVHGLAYLLPTVEEIEELYINLKRNRNFMYFEDFADCKNKKKYWVKVSRIYGQNEFILPYSHSISCVDDAGEISRYYVNPSLLDKIEWICEFLDKKANQLFILEHT
ncbi:hypothetical protein [uncultured Methanobrevibacter sp.]|uniref:hypothetical protein n=1 Tax=uncultured Methanobrevibacter sp. TaxID=253161 RepID=UPI0025CC55BF|nr:hypothetical protein [uncultured Methanobrevibacter sp.]